MRFLSALAAALLAAASMVPLTAAAAEREALVISGSLAYRECIALPPQSRVVVELRQGRDDGAVVATQTIATEGRQAPLPFALAVERDGLDAADTYQVLGRIVLPSGAAWASKPVMIYATARAIDLGTLPTFRVDAASGAATLLRCGDQTISADFSGNPVRLAVGDETFELRSVPAASGAKYEAIGDPGTILWNKGASTTLVLRGKALPECRDVAEPVFRAGGDEPSGF